MQVQRGSWLERQDPAKMQLFIELHAWERQLVLGSLEEAIRLIESGKVEKLTGRHLYCIGEYDAIEIDGECFFHRAFSSGKAVAACLAYAMEIGWQDALDDLRRFRLTVLGPAATASTSSCESTSASALAIE